MKVKAKVSHEDSRISRLSYRMGDVLEVLDFDPTAAFWVASSGDKTGVVEAKFFEVLEEKLTSPAKKLSPEMRNKMIEALNLGNSLHEKDLERLDSTPPESPREAPFMEESLARDDSIEDNKRPRVLSNIISKAMLISQAFRKSKEPEDGLVILDSHTGLNDEHRKGAFANWNDSVLKKQLNHELDDPASLDSEMSRPHRRIPSSSDIKFENESFFHDREKSKHGRKTQSGVEGKKKTDRNLRKGFRSQPESLARTETLG